MRWSKGLPRIEIVALSLLLATAIACRKDKSDSTDTTDTGTDTGTESPETPTVSVLSNQTLTDYPHAIDYYIPSNAEAAIIFLHGGGGKKEGLANSLGIKNDSGSSDYDVSEAGEAWLTDNKVLAVFPQGQRKSGALLAYTWNNYVMDSGQDDVAFLKSLVASILSDSSLHSIKKVYLVGHSNGGMMVNRMWCEAPDIFAGFGALAGPPAPQLDSSGAHPCQPSVAKPYIGIVGNADTELQTSGHMNASSWTLANYNASSPAWGSSTVLNEILYFSSRASLACGETPSAPVVSGQFSEYSACSNSLKEILVSQATIDGQPSGGDHCLADLNASCVTTLAGATGMDYKTQIWEFLKSF